MLINTLCKVYSIANKRDALTYHWLASLSWIAKLPMMLCLLLISACASVSHSQRSVMSLSEPWVLLPIQSVSNTTSVVDGTRALVETHLRRRGVKSVSRISQGTGPIVIETARNAGMRYAVSVLVRHWHPSDEKGDSHSVNVELSVMDLHNDTTSWSGKSVGKSRSTSTLTSAADDAIKKLIDEMELRENTVASKLDAINVASAALSQSGGEIPLVSTTSAVKSNGSIVSSVGQTQVLNADVLGKSVAIYYGATPPVDELSQFDRIVLEPDNISREELADLTQHGASAYAYLSVGEVGPSRSYSKRISDSWVLGENTSWNSKVLDLTNPEWVAFLLQRVDALYNAGYRGLFLDTMDSFHLFAKTDAQRAVQTQALASIVERIAQRYPGMRLISNRGFEILDTAGQFLEAVAAESLYASWNNAKQQYVPVPSADREWLMGKLQDAHENHGLDVIAIEYLPPERRDEARELARTIASFGFTPWISTPSLDYVGVGLMEVVPRKVMMLFDSRFNGQQETAQVHRFVAPILEYYGYVPVYLDVAHDALPDRILKGEFAGIVSWSSQAYPKAGLGAWYQRQMQADVPVAAFGAFPFALQHWHIQKMGIKMGGSIDFDSLKVSFKDELIGYEKALPVRVDGVGIVAESQEEGNRVHLSYTDKTTNRFDLVVSGDWGGYAVNPATSIVDFDKTAYWVTDPFQFLEKSLRLEPIPMPDVTTENGKRLWLAHIDGDALPSWAELPGRQLGAEVIHKQILERFNMPHSISVVEGEMTSVSAYANRRIRMFGVMKRMFALPEVELASHTFSHPFKWKEIAGHAGSGRYNLPVGHYQYNAEREIAGSAQFINENLAPPGKKTELLLWSGDALPDAEAIQAVTDAGMVNLNGGFTTITKAAPSVSRISPMARMVGPLVQAYAPIMNENVYTNDWTGPFDGFRRVIETLEMTDKPRRFKPLSIYYHFYAGTKKASIRSLEEIYEWSIAQDVMPVYASYYARKVPAYRKVGVAKYLDGSWKISSLGAIRSLRMVQGDRWPVLSSSRGIMGAKRLHDGIYIHTDGAQQVTFKTEANKPSGPYLVSANGEVKKWDQNGLAISFHIVAKVPAEVEISGSQGSACSVISNGKRISGLPTGRNTTVYKFSRKDTGNAILSCPA